jgi:hypothetical protein
MPPNIYYVYILIDPRKTVATPFYVGKGKGSRITDHFKPSARSYSKNPLKERVLSKIAAEGLKPASHVVAENLIYAKTTREGRLLVNGF